MLIQFKFCDDGLKIQGGKVVEYNFTVHYV